MQTDGMPTIERVSGKIGTLESMIDRLDMKLADARTSDGARSFMRQERSALAAAVVALKLFRMETEAVGGILDALRRLLQAMEIGSGVDDARYDAVDSLREWDE